jgi:hypothetical protein
MRLTQQEYRTKERIIFEYLGKLTKKWFRESLLDLLPDKREESYVPSYIRRTGELKPRVISAPVVHEPLPPPCKPKSRPLHQIQSSKKLQEAETLIHVGTENWRLIIKRETRTLKI